MKKIFNKKINIRTIMFISIYLSIMIIFSFTPQLGYVNIGITSFTTILVPITFMSIHYGYKGTLFAWFTFSILYFLQVFISFGGIIAVIGWDGAVVVYLLGKIATGIIMSITTKLLEIIENTKKINKKIWWWITFKIIVIATLGSILNGFIFMGLWYLMDSFKSDVMLAIFLTNFGIAFAIEIPLTITISLAAIPLLKYMQTSEINYKNNTY